MGPITLILLVLLIGAILSLLTNTTAQARGVALVSSFSALAISIWMYLAYDTNFDTVTHYAFEESGKWMPSIGINYHVGVDGISLPMVLLATIVCALCAIYSWNEDRRPNQFFALLSDQVPDLHAHCKCSDDARDLCALLLPRNSHRDIHIRYSDTA